MLIAEKDFEEFMELLNRYNLEYMIVGAVSEKKIRQILMN